MSEEEKEAIKIIEETHDMLVNPKLREEKYTTDDFEKAFYVVIMLIRKQQKEIEEKTTIIMAGAEKVKRLESQIEELLNVLNNEKKINYIKPIDIKIQNYISEDEIRELIKKYQEIAEDVKQKYKGTYAYRSDYLEALAKIEGYQELLEEK